MIDIVQYRFSIGNFNQRIMTRRNKVGNYNYVIYFTPGWFTLVMTLCCIWSVFLMAGLSTVVWNCDGTSWNTDGIMMERWNGDGIITDEGYMDGNSWNRYGNFLPTEISIYYGYLVPICTIELILGNDINSVIHNITGNFKESNLLVMHWNAGPAFFGKETP